MTKEEVLETLAGLRIQLEQMLTRFKKTREGLWIGDGDDSRFRQIVQELSHLVGDEFKDGKTLQQNLRSAQGKATANYFDAPSYYGVELLIAFASALENRVQRSPACLLSLPAANAPSTVANNRIEALYKLGERFKLVARQLRIRHGNRPTLDVNDEYDVQDLFHALLRLDFDDVRPEEWTPSYAGGTARIDFLLPEIEAVVEIKKSRPGLNARELGEQLLVDIAKYQKHPQARTLYCFVYDPDGRIFNPRGIENDLNAAEGNLSVRVLISQ